MLVRNLLLLVGLGIGSQAALGQASKKESVPDREIREQKLADLIDSEFDKFWKKNDITPAPWRMMPNFSAGFRWISWAGFPPFRKYASF